MITHRHFLSTGAAGAATACLTPRRIFAQEAQAPPMLLQARETGAAAKITNQKLRGNVSVLMGSGGNIAVLPGPQGKLLVDAGISPSRPRIIEALTAISSDPIRAPHQHALALRPHRRQPVDALCGRDDSGA